MITRSELRNQAYGTLMGKWKQPVLATLITLICNCVIQGSRAFQDRPMAIGIYTGFAFLFALIVVGPLSYGYVNSLLRFHKGQEESVKEMFNIGFKEDYARAFIVQLLVGLFVFLWALLLIIPGIIMAYAYAMTPFIAEENPELSSMECITKSKEMMSGHKLELFLLDLSFIGWLLLGFITCGIGLLWVMPYMNMARVKFYEQLKVEVVNNPYNSTQG